MDHPALREALAAMAKVSGVMALLHRDRTACQEINMETRCLVRFLQCLVMRMVDHFRPELCHIEKACHLPEEAMVREAEEAIRREAEGGREVLLPKATEGEVDTQVLAEAVIHLLGHRVVRMAQCSQEAWSVVQQER